ncbi:hypothetical protein CL620_03995 [archaeon]|nr:hypothetical protein [archaeon]
MREKKKRSIAKMISWRIIASSTTIVLVYLVTNRVDLSVGVGMAEALLKMAFYYTHERGWDKIEWGRKD